MAKAQLNVIEIDLNINIREEVKKVSREISGKTEEIADLIIRETSEKAEVIEQKKQAKADKKQEWKDKLAKCYELLKNANGEEPISSDQLLEISGEEKTTGLMIRLNNYVKKRGGEIKKRKKINKPHYWINQNPVPKV